MTYEIAGLTAAEHAQFFGPDWYEDEPTTPTGRAIKKAPPSKGSQRKEEVKCQGNPEQEIA